jgi:hypothetical protein
MQQVLGIAPMDSAMIHVVYGQAQGSKGSQHLLHQSDPALQHFLLWGWGFQHRLMPSRKATP